LVTWTSTVPGPSAGATTVRDVVPVTTTPVPAVAPNLTVSELSKLVPVTVTVFPPAVEPPVGDTALTVGVGDT
jgi:hypothetical protein